MANSSNHKFYIVCKKTNTIKDKYNKPCFANIANYGNLTNMYIDIYCMNFLKNIKEWIKMINGLGFGKVVEISKDEDKNKVVRIDCDKLKSKEACLFICILFRPFCCDEKAWVVPSYLKFRKTAPKNFNTIECLYFSGFLEIGYLGELNSHWFFHYNYQIFNKQKDFVKEIKASSKLNERKKEEISYLIGKPMSEKELTNLAKFLEIDIKQPIYHYRTLIFDKIQMLVKNKKFSKLKKVIYDKS